MEMILDKGASRLIKSFWGGVFILTVIGALLSSCSREEGKPRVLILGEDFSNTSALEHFREADESALNFQLEFVKNTFDVFNQKANQDLANGTGLYDVILHYSSVLSSYAKNRWVLTLAEQKALYPSADYSFEKDIFPEVWKDSSFYPMTNGGQPEALGYPFAANTMVLVYNRQMFDGADRKIAYRNKYGEELVPPTSWPQFRRIAEFFTASDRSTYGIVLQGASGSPLYWEWCNFAFGMGGGVMKKHYGWEGASDTPLILDSKETVAATEFYVSLKPFNAGDFFSTGQAEQQELMRTKRIAMAIMWSDSLFALVNGPQGQQFGFAPIPGGKSMIGGGTFYVNRHSKHAKESVRYITSVMQKDAQVKLMTQGLTSGLRSAYDAPEVKKLPYADAVRRSLDRGVYMLESGPDAGLISNVIERTVQRIWKGESSAEMELKAATKEVGDQRNMLFTAQKK